MSIDTNNSTITITEKAAIAVQEMFAEKNLEGYSLRVFANSGGCNCSGPQYGMAFENNQNPNDAVFSQFGIDLVVDDISADILSGAVIDYINDETGAGFKIDNPSDAPSSCGCGGSCG